MTNGRNYPTRIREVDRITEPGIGRIEVCPREPSLEDRFLHVLWPSGADEPAAPPASKLDPDASSPVLLVGNHVLVLYSGASTAAKVAYQTPIAGPWTHVLSGLHADARCSVRRPGHGLLEIRATKGGFAIFTTPAGGRFEIQIPAAPRSSS